MWRARRRRAALLASLAITASASAGAQQTNEDGPAPVPSALTVEDLLAVREPGRSPPAIAPDGGMVAYTLVDVRENPRLSDRRYARIGPTGVPRPAYGSQLWLTDLSTGRALNPTQGRGTSWAPVWSPDGRRLAFYWDGDGAARLWLWDRATGKLRAVSSAITRTFFALDRARWSPDGLSLITKVLPDSLTIERAADLLLTPASAMLEELRRDSVTVTVFRARAHAARSSAADTATWRAGANIYLADLAVIEVASGRTRRVVRSAQITGHWLSPDGRRVAYMTAAGKAGASSQQYLFDLNILDLSTGRSRVAAARVPEPYGISVSWSPDSRWLAYLTASIDLEYQIAGVPVRGDCFIVPADGGPPRNLTPGAHPYFGHEFRPPAWDATGRFVYLLGADTLWRVSPTRGALAPVAFVHGRQIRELIGPAGGGRLWSPDGGRTVYVAVLDTITYHEGFAALDLRTGAARILFEEPRTLEGDLVASFDANAHGIVYPSHDATHPPELWMASVSGSDRRPVSAANAHLAGKALGISRLVSWRGSDGTPLRGALLLPAGYRPGRRYPLIVWVYGGVNGSRSVNRFGMWGSLFNMQLFASRGYAVLYPDSPMRLGTPVADLAAAVVPGVDSLIASGLVDSARVGVAGHSYGGYSVLALLTESTRFRTGMSSAGMSDLFAAYGALPWNGETFLTAWAEEGQGRMGGTPWQNRERYLENSPFFRLDRVTASVLLIHGSNDSAVPSFLADQTYVGLRRLGKEVTYARYEGEDHAQVSWGAANARDYLNRVLKWFDAELAVDGGKRSSGHETLRGWDGSARVCRGTGSAHQCGSGKRGFRPHRPSSPTR